MVEVTERARKLVAAMPSMTTTQYVDESLSLIADLITALETANKKLHWNRTQNLADEAATYYKELNNNLYKKNKKLRVSTETRVAEAKAVLADVNDYNWKENLRKALATLMLCPEMDIAFKALNVPAHIEDSPCEHPGCLNHVTHPCEVCGRVAGRTVDKE